MSMPAATPLVVAALASLILGAGAWTLTHAATESEEGETMTTNGQACTTACGLPTSDEELRKLLTPEQYRIMKENGTEMPFQNEY
ncbi:MAG: hypothetical protein ABI743_12850, partial [bacterium]